MPYEKRILDVLKTGGTSSEKRVYKFAKRRVSHDASSLDDEPLSLKDLCSHLPPPITLQLGTHRRAMKKREEIKEYWSKLRARQAHA